MSGTPRPLHTAASIRAVDAAALADGASEDTLLERAGAAAAAIVRERYRAAQRIVVVCGAGNNGGDGFVVARLLHDEGCHVTCLIVATRVPVGAAGRALQRAAVTGVQISRVGAIGEGLERADLVVDALLGTGAVGPPRGATAEAIAAISRVSCPVVALDVPSGVDASTGEVAGVAVHASLTITFHAAKLGLAVMPGLRHAGTVVVVAIGLADGEEAPATVHGPEALARVPCRDRFAAKGDGGAVLVVGGSRGLTGAVVLAARGALRSGAAIVVAAVPASLEPIVEVKLTEAITVPVADSDGGFAAAGAAALAGHLARAKAVVLGPGAGRRAPSLGFLRAVALEGSAPVVLDADGLMAFAGDLSLLLARRGPTILTPHEGEAAALLGVDREQVSRRRLASAREIAARSRSWCLLKGADMVLVGPDGTVDVRDGDHPSLATAGSGDVLAGVIGALLARGAGPREATIAGAVAHLSAAQRAASLHPGRATIAGDLIDQLALAPWPPADP